MVSCILNDSPLLFWIMHKWQIYLRVKMCVCRERPPHNPHCRCWGRSVQVTVLHVKTVKTLLNRKSWKLEHEQDGKASLQMCKIKIIWSFMFSVTVKTFFCVRKRKLYSASGSSAQGSGLHVCSLSYIIFKIKVWNIYHCFSWFVSWWHPI